MQCTFWISVTFEAYVCVQNKQYITNENVKEIFTSLQKLSVHIFSDINGLLCVPDSKTSVKLMLSKESDNSHSNNLRSKVISYSQQKIMNGLAEALWPVCNTAHFNDK